MKQVFVYLYMMENQSIKWDLLKKQLKKKKTVVRVHIPSDEGENGPACYLIMD